MKQKAILLIALLALVSMMIIPASAETITGTLGGIVSTQSSYSVVQYATAAIQVNGLFIHNIEHVSGTYSVIHFDVNPGTYSAGAPSGLVTNFKGYSGYQPAAPGHLPPCSGNLIVTGSIGYQRSFTALGDELPGFQYVTFNNDWQNISGLTGHLSICMGGYNTTKDLGGWQIIDRAIAGNYPTGDGDIAWQISNNEVSSGNYLRNVYETNYAEYTVTKPSGIGITGKITKMVGGTNYLNTGWIFNGTSNAIISSQVSPTSSELNFSTPAESIKLGILTPVGIWYNSSILFAPAAPTVTPTPAPTIAPGYVRNTFVTIDGVNYNTIHGSNIMLRDVENSSWSNSTSDADGIFYIDTLPYHTINAYATYTVFANHYGDAELIGVETGISGMDYPIYMFPPGLDPGAGNINLYIPVVDRDTNFAIGSVGVQVELPTGAITGDITGPGGDAAVFVVPNNTVIRARASKTGYGPVTESFNSGEVSPKTKTLYMQKLVVTIAPTSTIPTMGITTAITVDPRTDVKKAEDAFSKWMNILGDVTDIAIGVVIIWLMWLTVYMITGGKIIDKIMKRGRR